ncbi:RlpA-like double-psi beta-barrel-protein domain-containing protein-containing protein, partial [Ephemerocybe angulata]
ATFFFQNGNRGACGQFNPDSSLIAALPETRFGYDYSKISPECGKRIKVTNTNNGRSVTVTVADSCPTCVNANSLDLSQGAFDQITSEEDGMIPSEYSLFSQGHRSCTARLAAH